MATRFFVLYSLTFVAPGAGFAHVATVDVEGSGDHFDKLETLFRACNTVDGSAFEVPRKIRNRSMSVGDVVLTEEAGLAFRCASFGWDPLGSPEVAHLSQFIKNLDGTGKDAPLFVVQHRAPQVYQPKV